MLRSTSAKAACLAPVLLAACGAAGPDEALQSAAPVFDPSVFFAGRTAGQGTVNVILRAKEPLRVEGAGRVEGDGTLVLDQIVRRGARPPERRQWRFRRLGPGSYGGTLSDATGPVRAEVSGNRLHLRYPMKGGVQAEQWLYLQRDGRTALNRMSIRKFGMAVAHIDETIRKLD